MATIPVTLSFMADTAQAKQQLQSLQQTLYNLGKGTNLNEIDQGLTGTIIKAQQQAGNLGIALKNATNVDTGKLNLTKFSTELKKQGKTLSDYRAELAKLGPTGQQAFMNLTQSIMSAEVQFRNTNKLVNGLWNNLKYVAKYQMSSAALNAIVGTFRDSLKYAQELNESLNNIRIVTGQSIEQMAKFAEQANKAAKALSTTTTEYTNASLIFYQQGLNDQQVKERTDITIKMANASQQSAETVSDQLTAVWNNFDNGTKSLESYADAMVALGADTASSSEEIATGLEKFAAIAETTGLSFEYASAALATVTATTRQSADVVGTAFKTLFARIQNLKVGNTLEDGTTLGKYSEALYAVGVNIKDANGGLKDMDIILNEMAGVWGNLDRDQKIALAQTVAGVRQYTQLMALMENWDFMEENLQTVQDSTGALQQQADIYAESWEAANDRVKASAEGIYQSLINDEFIIDLTDGFAGFLSLIEKLVDSMGGFKGVLSAVYLIFAKILNQKMQSGIANMAQSLYSYSAAGRQQALDLKNTAAFEGVSALQEGMETGGYSSVGDNQRAINLKNEYELQKQILSIERNLTEEEKKQIEYGFQVIKNAGEELARKKDLLQQDEEALGKIRKEAEIQNRKSKKKNKKNDLDTQAIYQNAKNENAFVQELKNYGVREKTARKIYAWEEKIAKKHKEINELSEQYNNTVSKGINTKKFQLSSFEIMAKNITTTFNAVSQLTIGFSSLTSAWETFSNPDLSGWEKFSSIMMSLSMGLPMMVTGLNNLNSVFSQLTITQNLAANFSKKRILNEAEELGIDLAQVPVKTALLGLKSKETKEDQKAYLMSKLNYTSEQAEWMIENQQILTKLIKIPLQEKETAGTKKQTLAVAAKNVVDTIQLALQSLLNAQMLATLAIIGAIVAVIFILVKGVQALVNWWNQDVNALEEANKKLSEQKTLLNETKQSYDELKSSIENYEKSQQAIATLKTGTEEWRNAIQEANQQVIELLNRYPQLVNYINNTNGRLTIQKQGLKILEEQATQQIENQRQQVNAAQIRVNQAQAKVNKTNFIRNSGDYYTGSDWWSSIGNYAAAGTAAGAVGFSLPGAVVGLIAGTIGGIVDASVENAQAGNNMEQAIEGILQLYKTQGETIFVDFNETISKVAQGNTALAEQLKKEKETVQNLIRTEQALDKTNQLLVQEMVRSNLGENATEAEVAKGATQEQQSFAKQYAEEQIKDKDLAKEYLNKVLQDTVNYRIENGKLQKKNSEGAWEDKGNMSNDDLRNNLLDYYANQYFANPEIQKEISNEVNLDKKLLASNGLQFNDNQMAALYNNQLTPDMFTFEEWNKFQDFITGSNNLPRPMDFDEWFAETLKNEGKSEWYRGLSGVEQTQAKELRQNEYNSYVARNTGEIYTTANKIEGADLSLYEGVTWEDFQKQQLENMTNYAELTKSEQAEVLEYYKTLSAKEKKIFQENADFKVDKNKEAWEQVIKDGKQAEKETKQLNFFTNLGTAQEDLEEVNKALEKIGKGEYVDNVSKLQETFGGLGEAWTNFVNASTPKEQEQALKGLAEAYIEQKGLLDSVDVSYRKVAIAQLRQLGFANAEILVNNKIKEQLWELVAAEKEQWWVEGKLNEAYFENLVALGYTEQELNELKNTLNMTANEFETYIINALNSGTISKQSAIELYKLKISLLNLNSAVSAADYSSYLSQLASIGALSKQSLQYVATLQSALTRVQWNESKKTYEFAPQWKAFYDKYYSGMTADQYIEEAMAGAEKNITYEPLTVDVDEVGGSYTPPKDSGSNNSGKDNKYDVDILEKLNSEIDRLEDENRRIEQINKLLEKQNELIAETVGEKKLIAIKRKEELLAEKEAALNIKRDEAITQRSNLKASFADRYGIELDLDSDGNLLNSENVREQMNQKIIDLQNHYNSMTNPTEEDKQWHDYMIDSLKNFVNNYHEFSDEIVSIDDEIRANMAEQKSALMEEIVEQFEPIREEAQKKLDLIEFRVDINEDDLNGIIEDFVLMGESTKLLETQMASVNNQLHETMLRWDELSVEERTSKLEDLASEAQSIAEAGKELRENWLNSYGDVLSQGLEDIEKSVERFDDLNNALEHYKSLMELLGKSTNFKQLDNILKGQSTVIKNNMDTQKEVYNMLQRRMNDIDTKLENKNISEEERKALERMKEDLTPELAEAYDTWLGLAEEYAQNLQDILVNSLAEASSILEEKLTNGLGFDLLQSQIEGLQATDEVYLTETNKQYETNKLIRQAQVDIDKTSNKIHQQMLRNFQQQTKQLQQQKKLSKDELEIQQLQYDLLVAKIALEEAQNAKSKVRLMRDSQGNFNYVYTADQDVITEAQQTYDDAENALYNKYLEVTNSNASLMQQVQKEFYDEVSGLDPTDPQYLDKINDAQKRALDKLTMYYEQYGIGIEGLGDKINEAWVTDMMSNIDSIEEFEISSENYLNKAKNAYNNYKNDIDSISKDVGLSYSETAEKVNEVTSASEILKTTAIENKELTENALIGQGNALVNWMKENDKVISAMIERAEKYSIMTQDSANFHQDMIDAAKIKDRAAFDAAAAKSNIKVAMTGNDWGVSTDDLYNQLKWFDTGGYTGKWGESGKLAVLHEKELILNQDDTKNFLSALDLTRTVLHLVNLSANRFALSNLSSNKALQTIDKTIEQKVAITAEFPNATNKEEIKAAFDDIINEAVQYAGIKR